MTPPSVVFKSLRLASALVLLATIGIWLGTGAHLGWTRTSVTDMQHDDITGIDFPVERAKFVAGIEILAAGTGLAVTLALASLLGRRRDQPNASSGLNGP